MNPGNMSKYIQNGPNIDYHYPYKSVGETMFDIIKSKDKDRVIMIEEETNTKITYGQIMEESVKCAIALQKIGIKRDDVIIAVSANDYKCSIVLLACWYIGAIYSPLNVKYTVGEMVKCFKLSVPKLVFCQSSALNAVLEAKNQVNCFKYVFTFDNVSCNSKNYGDLIENKEDDIYEFSPISFDIKEQGAIILYSSGTTGPPKGVLLSHFNIRFTMTYIRHPLYLNIAASDVTVSALPYFHMFGIILILGSIANGMELTSLKSFKPEVFLRTIQESKVTRLFLVPSLAVFLAKSPLVDKYNVSSVKGVICGAAPLGQEIEEILKHRLNVPIVRQIYGMTECSGVTHCFPTGRDAMYGSTGILVPRAKCKVIDIKDGNQLGPNQTGELCLKGDFIMLGYINDHVSSKALFDSEGYVRSGDIGYYNSEGYFYIVDRLKELIKYKGFQVAPAELEGILLKHEGVKEVAIVGKPDEKAGELAVAFVIKQTGLKINEEELIKYIGDHVSPQKQLHGGVIFIDELPKNETGKVLRRKLRDRFK